jgi:predicted lipoprotein
MQLADMSFERILLGIEKIYKKKELHELTEADAKDFIRRLELRVKNDINKAEDTSVEDKAAYEEDKQNKVSEAVRDIGNQATDNTNQFTEI